MPTPDVGNNKKPESASPYSPLASQKISPLQAFKRENKITLHYHGDITRRLFLLGGIVMLLTLPLFNHLLPVPAVESLVVIVILVFVAGFTSPHQIIVIGLTAAVAAGVTIAFTYCATLIYASPHRDIHRIALFIVDMLLALNFLFALYFSIKTLRGRLADIDRENRIAK